MPAIRRITGRRRQASLLILLSAVALPILLLSALFPANSPAPEPSAAGTLRSALGNLESRASYRLLIEERSPSYKLTFEGRVNNDNMAGFLQDFNLQATFRNSKLYLREADGSGWQCAKELQLEGLESFLLTPLQVLKSQQHNFSGAFFGETVETAQSSRQTVYLTITEDRFTRLLFPEIDPAAVERVSLGAALAETDSADNQMMKQLIVIVEFKEAARGAIQRLYYLN